MKSGMRKYLVLLIVFSASVKAQEIKPYLQSPSPGSVWISWKTDSGIESLVQFGEDSSNLQHTVSGNCEILSMDSSYFYHSVRLTGLEADHYYYYRAVTGSLSSAVYRFRSQPPTGQKSGIYRFLILGDHQIINSDRYERLMQAAREKVREKFGGRIEDHINLIINDGDQVDKGTLDQYEHVHFEQSASLSGNIPIMTTVGNHETYGTPGLPLYYSHFFYNDLGYKGISSPGGENYYSYQEKNLVFIHLSSEHPTHEQVEWVQQIVDSVKADTTVDWMISVAHRPIQAEQYVGDISVYIRDRIIPILTQTEKCVLHITGHHHLYARGQLRDFPVYHIISGAAAWDQYWGQSTEKDFDDEQKTIDYWTYQIATIDDGKKEMTVESYAIGSPKLGFTLNNILIDSFYRKKDLPPPDKPSIVTVPGDTITLPYTFTSSPYSTSTNVPYNSVRFQISADEDFSDPDIDLIMDYENLYGTTGFPDYKPVDINNDLDIFRYIVARDKLPDGNWFIRTRHRDRNIEWSEWSDPVHFIVKESSAVLTHIATNSNIYHTNEDIEVQYRFGPGNPLDWIGIYKTGDIPGSVSSTAWEYVSGDSGTVSLKVSEQGKYFIAFFEDDGYNELADRIQIYVINTPVLVLNKKGYDAGEDIRVDYSKAPAFSNDWIGIYRLSDHPGTIGSTRWSYTTGIQGNVIFQGLPAGYYFACYFLEDGYTEACDRIIFSVGSDLAVVNTDTTIYKQGQGIVIRYENSPGTGSDWMGILKQNAPAGTAPLVDRQFIGNMPSGSVNFDTELDPGEYFASLYINNSSLRVSNKALFVVESPVSGTDPYPGKKDISLYPSPTSGILHINFAGMEAGNVSVKVASMAGVPVLEKQLLVLPGTVSGAIDLSGEPPGIYMVFIRYGDELIIRKIVLQ